MSAWSETQIIGFSCVGSFLYRHSNVYESHVPIVSDAVTEITGRSGDRPDNVVRDVTKSSQ